MRCLSFLLIISLFFCYTGIAAKVHHSSALLSIGNQNAGHRECHKKEISGHSSTDNYYHNTETTNHEMLECCHYMLPNAPNSNDFNLVNTLLYLIAADIPASQNIKASSSILNLEIKRKYQPPDLFLQNSSFLI